MTPSRVLCDLDCRHGSVVAPSSSRAMFTCPEPTTIYAVFYRHAVWRLSQELAEILEPTRGAKPLPCSFHSSCRQFVSVQVDRIMAYMRDRGAQFVSVRLARVTLGSQMGHAYQPTVLILFESPAR